MFLLHFLIPILIFYFFRSKTMLLGLLLGNLIDLDHIFYRLIGKVSWFESACSNLGESCSYNFYPLHNLFVMSVFLAIGVLILVQNKEHLIYKKAKFKIDLKSIKRIWKDRKIILLAWTLIGAFFNVVLDLIGLATGIVL